MNIKTFCISNDISYREISMVDCMVNKFYEVRNPNRQQIISNPDGCIDIEFVLKDKNVYSMLCGSFRQGTISKIGNYEYCFGIKFNPGMLPQNFKVNVSSIINTRCALCEFMDNKKMEKEIFECLTLEEKMNYILSCLEFKNESSEIENIIKCILSEVEKSLGYVNVKDLIEHIGYSHCYTDRFFKNAIGFSIKKYANIMRIQNSIDILKSESKEDIFEKLGYYDQAHFIKDFKRFTMYTPKLYMKKENTIRFV